MAQNSRRKFLKTASATAAALAVSRGIPAWAGVAGSAAPVQVWATYRDRRHAQAAPLAWKPATEATPDAIVLDPGATRQEILGFGAALTDAACYVLSQIPQVQREELLPHLHRLQ
jgi:glucosylceramidase